MTEIEALQKELKSFRPMIFGTCLIIWIMAVFIIFIFYSFNRKLDEIQGSTQNAMSQYANTSLDRFQVVDPVDQKVLYSFERKTISATPPGMVGTIPGSVRMTPRGEDLPPGVPRPVPSAPPASQPPVK